MSSISSLFGLPSDVPVYYSTEGIEDIASGSYCIPIGWLAMFTEADVICVANSEDESSTCPSLIASKDEALSNLRRRIESHTGKLDPIVIEQFKNLENIVQDCTSEFIQVDLTDIDIFVSFPESIGTLREWVAAMDTSDAARWAEPLGFAQIHINGDLNNLTFSNTDFIASGVMGYVA